MERRKEEYYLLESSLCEQVALDSGQGFVGVVVGLLYKTELLPLLLVQPDSHCVLLLQTLQSLKSMYVISKCLYTFEPLREYGPKRPYSAILKQHRHSLGPVKAAEFLEPMLPSTKAND